MASAMPEQWLPSQP